MLTLVTGGGGFLGRYLVEQLQARGEKVRIFSRGEYPDLSRSGVEVVRGDLRDQAAVSRAVQGVASVFHVAALPGIWGDWKRFYEINTLGTLHILRACQELGVQRLIYTSSPSVVYDGRSHLDADESLPYPRSWLCHYPHSKALAEQAVLAADNPGGLRTVALRPHLIWGPRDNHLIPRLVERARTGRLIRVGSGENLISMSYVENTAAAHLQAHDALMQTGKNAGKAYFVNEPEPVRLWEWIGEILALGGLPPVRFSLSPAVARGLGVCFELGYTLLRMQSDPPLTRFLASQLSQSHTYSVQRAQADFGYSPVVTVAEGMRRLAPEIRRQAGQNRP